MERGGSETALLLHSQTTGQRRTTTVLTDKPDRKARQAKTASQAGRQAETTGFADVTFRRTPPRRRQRLHTEHPRNRVTARVCPSRPLAQNTSHNHPNLPLPHLYVFVLYFVFCFRSFSPRIACRGERRAPLFVLILLFLVFHRPADPWGSILFGISFLGISVCDHGNRPSQVLV